MGNKIIDFRNKKRIKTLKTEEKIGREPEVTLKITFDDDETLIMDLRLLGDITEKVSNELEEMEKRFSKTLGLSLLAAIVGMGGNPKDIESLFRNKK